MPWLGAWVPSLLCLLPKVGPGMIGRSAFLWLLRGPSVPSFGAPLTALLRSLQVAKPSVTDARGVPFRGRRKFLMEPESGGTEGGHLGLGRIVPNNSELLGAELAEQMKVQ